MRDLTPRSLSDAGMDRNRRETIDLTLPAPIALTSTSTSTGRPLAFVGLLYK